MTNEPQLRQEICRVGRSLFERGYVHATAGNISARLPDGFLMTPSDICLGFLEPQHLAKVKATTNNLIAHKLRTGDVPFLSELSVLLRDVLRSLGLPEAQLAKIVTTELA